VSNSPAGTAEAIEEVCRCHLPKFQDFNHQVPLVPAWFLDLEFAHVVEKKSQAEAIDEIEKSLRKTLKAIDALHPDLDRAIEWEVARNLETDEPVFRLQTFTDIDGQSTPIQTYDNLKLLVGAALSAFIGQPADAKKLASQPRHRNNSAIIAAKEALSDLNMMDISAQERANESWQKALTVKRCRMLWSVGMDAKAPISYTGKFALFLDDIIIALGKFDTWSDPRSVMQAWRSRAKHDGWFL